jgi:hypothetical protein
MGAELHIEPFQGPCGFIAAWDCSACEAPSLHELPSQAKGRGVIASRGVARQGKPPGNRRKQACGRP